MGWAWVVVGCWVLHIALCDTPGVVVCACCVHGTCHSHSIHPTITPINRQYQMKEAAVAEKRAKRRAEAEAAAEELKARRRALGNIQYISYLYRFGMLTENIMHK